MKRLVLVLAVAAACSGQMCASSGSSGTAGLGGRQNICGRSWFDSTYRIGVELPSDVNPPQSATVSDGIEAEYVWQWPASQPPVEFSVAVFQQGSETLADYRQAWLDFVQNGQQFTLLNEANITLDDGAEGWYLAVSPLSDDGINQEFVMTVTQNRLVYVSALYGVSVVTDQQVEQIGDVLHSLCADIK